MIKNNLVCGNSISSSDAPIVAKFNNSSGDYTVTKNGIARIIFIRYKSVSGSYSNSLTISLNGVQQSIEYTNGTGDNYCHFRRYLFEVKKGDIISYKKSGDYCTNLIEIL